MDLSYSYKSIKRFQDNNFHLFMMDRNDQSKSGSQTLNCYTKTLTYKHNLKTNLTKLDILLEFRFEPKLHILLKRPGDFFEK